MEHTALPLPFEAKYNDNTATVHNLCAKNLFSEINQESIDLVVTSPPYFIGKEYDRSNKISDFILELNTIMPEIDRALKPGGSICWQVGNHVQNGTVDPLDFHVMNIMNRFTKYKLRNRLIWTFGHGTHASNRFSGRHETILWYTKGDDYYFNLNEARIPQIYPGKRHYKGPKKGQWSGNPLGKNPGDVWDIGQVWSIPNVKANHIEKTDHPCQFPVSLVRRLVAALCPPNGTVVDPYLGSGTTAIAALLEGHNFIGSDNEEKYISITKSRLAKLAEGELRFRPDVPTHVPKGTESVAVRPTHFARHGEEA